MNKSPDASNLDSVFSLSERSKLGEVLRSQEFWIVVAVLIIGAVVGMIAPRFLTGANMANILQNFCFTALMAIGMTPVIMTGGIDISVGSTLGLTGVLLGLFCASGYPFPVVVALVLLVGAAVGAVNGALVSYMKLPPFIVTLGMMSLVRSQTLVVTNNQVVYDFGKAGDTLLALGSGSFLGVPNVLWAVIVSAVVMQWLLSMTKWGRYVRAIGGNENAARLSGIPVDRVKVSTYALLGAMTGMTAIFLVGWMGAATNALGQGQELQVIAATVIGGANLLGGFGTSFGAVIGSVLIEVIRNALLLAGVNPFWQGTFVGLFILFAVLLERFRSTRA
ncbi:ABC transporter permease [Mesorhizobium sp. M1C.F.Ca.ET.193.01.1.1]|uniref:ABC transporter permease n=1 Tax=unclassified Mesorhizobium TaxID=325217 RepID=UPI000FD403D6|nr:MULTISPECIES: ABC transporter permease [unclassified Mesorhizobium]TGT02268.1 ABC transporter permease [bacterium M00.F.Ca.ET.177.01.1.1]TGQ54520.1 ABC transporter permease [Mesorhizobium sp. M1C.F.Ca.ET.210.01.1.1]TGQ72516.1 ABC transporter permease [Mesorhizobium sp. M1C.F.Ca.ET.212.01.1.1]TGR10312.1 ABC transporter permease [Mesorhizobium sp. M1C.F.Ca.ET.204.01.1.1]TGR30915.1 ABC transporter permease [Mesorhizobium sp. M1C.F.Ca.ET.196.01.1.1]